MSFDCSVTFGERILDSENEVEEDYLVVNLLMLDVEDRVGILVPFLL